MGYSLCARFKTSAQQQAMYAFYIANSDIIESLSAAEGRTDAEQYMDLHLDERLSYAPHVKNLLGYDGPSGRPYYLELLIAWMAVKSTYRDKSNEPFIYYDTEKILVQQKNSLLLQVDDNGMPTFEDFLKLPEKLRRFRLYEVKDFERYNKTVTELFTTLEERWQALKPKSGKKPAF